IDLLTKVITFSADWGESADNIPDYLVYEVTYPEVAWENVGWFAKSDYELVFVMDAPLDGFYLKYNLPSPLVNIEMYDACASVVDGVYTNTYCTSAETTMSYGPYKLTSYQADKQYVLEKNEYFYDLSEDTYQATSIVVDCVKEPATRLELFLQGKLDTFGLTKDYMDEYQMSDYTYYATGDSTFAMVFNPDAEALVTAQAAAGENINKTILTIKEFRQAMSYALDRNAFCLATSPMNAPGFGLFSGLIVSDPEAGTAYRTTDVAKNVLAEFWGVSEEYGEGKLYADIDEAVDSITGYNLAKAKELYDLAYDMAIEQGLMDEDDVVEIKIGTPNNTSTFYNNGYEFLVNNYTEAVKGTKLEGKLTFSRDDTLGNAFSDALKNNQVDMLFGVGWTGSALDPYGLIEAYVYTDYQYDDCTDFTAITCDIEINGTVYTASVQDWQKIMNGAACTITAADGSTMEYSCGTADKDPETRLAILGALEGAVLQNYNFLPIMDDASAQLRGQQIEYYTEEYIFGMGFGGMKYYTFNYTDAEWDAYVASNGGELDYT
ncbi:MAG: ABC transporter substrate-binding protein, partial [Bacteroidaceae bacterium]|nr:ABC transporter substrate-binding protein [Bacteroidaceae bacterium]